MFSGFMVNAWIVATIVALVGGAVGFFVVLRGSAFVAHAVPNGSFAGAALASLIGINTIVGLGVFSLGGAFGIGLLGRRGRHDVATALTLVFMLGLGALFLSFSVEYAPEIYSLLFGEVLGISTNELAPTAGLAIACLCTLALLYRPLLLSSVLPEASKARGISPFRIELCFLVILALATTMTVPVVGTALIFSLLIGPPAAARAFTNRPQVAIALSVAIALVTVWAAIALSYQTNWPVGFFVGTISAMAYACGRAWGFISSRHAARQGPAGGPDGSRNPSRRRILGSRDLGDSAATRRTSSQPIG
jgi:zinc/manganese transport system permease protein